MKKIKMIIELEYDDKFIHGGDLEGIEWFYNKILIGEGGLLLLHSNEIGDHIGSVKGIEILSANTTNKER